MDIDQMLRTYMHLNDPKYQNLTFKFAGALLIAALALGISVWSGAVHDSEDGAGGPGGVMADRSQDGSGDEATVVPDAVRDYVGYDPATFDAATYDPRMVQSALDDWYRDHPGVALAGPIEPEARDGVVIGYWIAYR